MTEKIDYQLANAIRKEGRLAALRAEFPALSGEKVLDRILGYSQPATLVQSFPDQDLHFLMHHIGADDFLPVLSLASSEQWEYLMDIETWDQDRLNLINATRIMDLLFQADPQRFLRWTIKEKPDLLEYYFFRHMEIRVREHDEDPSDFGDDFTSIDNVIYFRFPGTAMNSSGIDGADAGTMDDEASEPEVLHSASHGETDIGGALAIHHQATEELILRMLNTLVDMDISVYQGVLLETASIIPAETEEEQFRLRSIRLAEKGLLPRHEAIGIYQPIKKTDLKKRPEKYLKESVVASGLPRCALYPFSILKHDSLFARSLSLVDNEMVVQNLQMEFAFLVNSIVSADALTIRSREALEKVVDKACSYLGLGMELLLGRDAERLSEDEQALPRMGAFILRRYPLMDIFRTASTAGMALKKKAGNWYKNSYMASKCLPLTFLGEQGLGIVGGLLLDFPLYFDNYETGVLYRAFASFKEIFRTSEILDGVIEMDRILSILEPGIGNLSGKILTGQAILLTLWARDRVGLSDALEPIEMERFKPFFQELFSQADKGKIHESRKDDFIEWIYKTVLRDEHRLPRAMSGFVALLFAEIEEAYGFVRPGELDERFISHFYLVGKNKQL